MFSKIAPVAFLATAAIAAPVLEERSLYCIAQDLVIGALRQNTQATAFCSNYLGIPVVTSTVTSTALATVTALATATVTSTTTGAKITSTCAPVYANKKRGLVSSSTSSCTVATPTALVGLASGVISADCSCLSIPTSTTTLTVAKTNAVTVTKVAATTTAVVTVTPTAVASQLYDLNGTYTASNAAKFQLYPNLDFPGNDAYHGDCGASGDAVTTVDGTFSCLNWNDCMNICATASWGCVGVSFVPSWNTCYLKTAVPGNGVANCGTVQPEIVESALNLAQGNTYAVSS